MHTDGYTYKKVSLGSCGFIDIFSTTQNPIHPNPLQNGAQPHKLGTPPYWDTPPLFYDPI